MHKCKCDVNEYFEWKFEYIEYKFEYIEWKFEYIEWKFEYIEYKFEYIEYMQLWVTSNYPRGDLHRLHLNTSQCLNASYIYIYIYVLRVWFFKV